MKPKSILRSWSVAACFLFITNLAVFAQGTAFTYQGLFTQNGTAFSGTVEMQFTLWDAVSSGTPVAVSTPSSVLVAVSNGLFTVPVDFSAAPFSGSDRWVQVDARTTLGPFTTLTPRQKVTATPYAIRAANFTGTVGSNQLVGTYTSPVTFSNSANVFNGAFTGSGSGLSNLNATSIGGLGASNFWNLGGNAGTTAGVNFLGTTDNQPLELKANGQRTLRLEPATVTDTNILPGYSVIFSNAPNVIGGTPGNTVDPGVAGAFIGGGGMAGYYYSTGSVHTALGSFPNRVSAHFGTIGGGWINSIQTGAFSATISGGAQNTIQTNAYYATIAGGNGNSIRSNAAYAAIGGGGGNSISGNTGSATIGGGSGNTIRENAKYATIGGGSGNNVFDNYATVPGGSDNYAAGDYSFAAGRNAFANSPGAFVWADSTGPQFRSTAPNQFLIRAAGGVGIGSAVTPNGALHLRSGGLAISGASSPYYGTPPGVYIESGGTIGNVFAFDYGPFLPLPLVLNAPGGAVGIGRTPTANTLEVNGNASKTVAGSWLANSDRRIKSDIKPVDHALATLEKVRLVSFRYTDDYRASHRGVDDRRYLNVVAQEFREVFPEHVKSSGEKLANGDEILQVDTYPLTIYSAAAIQELDSKLKAKEAKINELENRLSALEKILSRERNQNGGAQ